MYRFFLLCSLVFTVAPSRADLEADLTIQDIQLNGVMAVGEHGFICVSESDKKHHLTLTRIDLKMDKVWSVDLKYAVASKKSEPIDTEILSDKDNLYWISKGSRIRVAVLNVHNGAILQPETEINGAGGLDPEFTEFVVSGNQLYVISNNQGNLFVQGIANGNMSGDRKALLPTEHQDVPRRFGCRVEGNICSYAYTIDRLHSRMEVNIACHDVNGEEISSRNIVLRSTAFSFTYNSLYDRDLMTLMRSDSGFILFGKLDYQFDQGYVSNPEEAAFTGFWVARIDRDLEDHMYSEFPFAAMPEVIPAGAISRYVIIDLKEDENGDIYFNFTLEPIIFDAQSYIFHLSPLLELKHANKGKIERNFFDYNRYGVRNLAKSNNLIMRKDLWRYQSFVFLPYITNSSAEYSRAIQVIQQLFSARSEVYDQDKAYTFQSWGRYMYFFEYTLESKGTLRVYKAIR